MTSPRTIKRPPPIASHDGQGWSACVWGVAYGYRVAIRVNAADAMPRVMACLPAGWKPAVPGPVDRLYSLKLADAGSRRYHVLHGDDEPVARAVRLGTVLEALEADIEHRVAEGARRWVFVHAGVVGWRGEAIVIPGRSFSGKTTLVTELIRAGATYYSDEYAVLDARGRVHPYPRPLSLRDRPRALPRKCPVELLGGLAGVGPLPVRWILVTEYKPGARWRPRPLSHGRGVLALLANTVPARRRPQAALATLELAAAGACILKGNRGEARETADTLLRRFSARSTPPSGTSRRASA